MTLPLLIATWPADWQDAYQERAAIMEYDGRMARLAAERAAERDVRIVAARKEL